MKKFIIIFSVAFLVCLAGSTEARGHYGYRGGYHYGYGYRGGYYPRPYYHTYYYGPRVWIPGWWGWNRWHRWVWFPGYWR